MPAQRAAANFAEFREAIANDRGTAKGQQYIAAPCGIAPDDAKHNGTETMRGAIGKPHRCKECVLPAAFVGLDADKRKETDAPEVASLTPESFAALVAIVGRYSGIVYTTASHATALPRCRVVLELDQAAPRAERIRASLAIRARIDKAMKAAGYGHVPWDSACDRPEQPLFLPVTDSHVYMLDGAPLCLGELLADIPEKPTQGAHDAPHGPPVTTPTRYALAALDSALRAIAACPEHDRNNLLNKEAHGLGGFVPSGQLPQTLIEAALIDATERAGWATPEANRTKIRDGIASGILEPRGDGLPAPDAAALLRNAGMQLPASNDEWGFVWGDEMTSPARLKPSEWAIRKVLPLECTGLMFGAWGTCKTFVAIDMAGCIANGLDWHGKPTQQGTVFYLAGEGETGFARRMRAWEIANKASMAGMAFREMPQIRKPQELARLVTTIAGLAKERGAPRLIVLDTLFTALAGGQENDGKDMGEIFEAMKLMRQQFRCAVLTIHHTGHDGDRARGHSSMPAGVDVQFYLKARASGGATQLELANPKQKDGKQHPLIFLTAESVEITGLVDEDGETESSLVIRAPTADMLASMREKEDAKAPDKPDLLPIALDLRARGHTLEQIAQQIGRDKGTVSRWFKDAA
jgi:hypothetical protein